MSNLNKYFFFSKRIILVIYSATTFLIILFSYFFNLTLIQLLGTILFFAILDSLLIFIINKNRKDELITIKNVIEKIDIRKNDLKKELKRLF